MFLFLSLVTYHLLHSIGIWLALSIRGTTDTQAHALNLSSSDPKFKQLEHFLTNVKISIPTSNSRGTKTIRGLIEHVRRFTFLKNDGQESTVAVCFFIISIRSFYPVTNYCKAPLIISTSGIPKSLV